jgi:hypothetical protein
MNRLFLVWFVMIELCYGQTTASPAPTVPPTSSTSTILVNLNSGPLSNSSELTHLSTSPSSPRTETSTASQSKSSSASASPKKSTASTPPDVFLDIPKLHVGSISLDVDSLNADINLNANIAQLVQINAGVQISVRKVNLTVTDVDAQLQLIIRLSNLANIVQRVFASLDLNPLLINAANNVTSHMNNVVGAVEGLLGSITQGETTLNFLIDNLGNIVQETKALDSTKSVIIGNYIQNMTFTGEQTMIAGGMIQKSYDYAPLNAVVNIIFNPAGQIVQAVVQKARSTN